MPWKIEKRQGGFFVVNQDSGKLMNKKPHASKAEAENHLRAIYANAPHDYKEYFASLVALKVEKEVDITGAMGVPAHGPGGLFSSPGLSGGNKTQHKKRIQRKPGSQGAQKKEHKPKVHMSGETAQVIKSFEEALKGGPGSGNFGHGGRPGSVGGSTSGGHASSKRPQTAPERLAAEGKTLFDPKDKNVNRQFNIDSNAHDKYESSRKTAMAGKTDAERLQGLGKLRENLIRAVTTENKFGQTVSADVYSYHIHKVAAEASRILSGEMAKGMSGVKGRGRADILKITANALEESDYPELGHIIQAMTKGDLSENHKTLGSHLSTVHGYEPEEIVHSAVAALKRNGFSKSARELQGILTGYKREHRSKELREELVKEAKEFIASGKERGILVIKEKSGDYRWFTFSSNAFRDRDGEIVSRKALEDDVDRADNVSDYGPLRWWHVDGLDIGDCDFNMMQGRILVESGTFRSPVVAEQIKEHADDLQVSIGFYHPLGEPDDTGTFHHIKRFERSLLPAGKASNLLTAFVVKGV